MTYSYKTKGTCSKAIHLEIDDDGVVKNVKFDGGCAGNTSGLSKLAIGRPAKEIANILRGTKCGIKSTSCPDQLAKAIDELL